MSKYIRQIGAPLALTCALMAGACTTDKKNDQLAQDSAALNRDLNLAGTDTAARPALQDVPAAAPTTTTPAAPAPRTSTPARTTTRPAPARTTTTTPAPRPSNTTASGNTVTKGTGAANGGGAVGSIASGTTINLTSTQRICTNTNKVGDKFTATVAEAVSGSNGAIIPAGATATVTVTQLKRSENANDKVIMGFAVNSISYGGHTYAIDSDVTYAKVENVRNESKGKDAQKVLGGAAVGAVLGQVIGKNTKGTVIGAAAGAAAGAGAAVATANYEGCVPDGGRIQIKLTSPAQVRA
ncbi:MAG TPA: glycine zipper 2TM domain-containing protein [Gemmatimonadaceae bacterium]|nr:glycine zipper 2TM domain-containing protein [Gemmatimonadaceae bacterium]